MEAKEGEKYDEELQNLIGHFENTLGQQEQPQE